MEVIVDQPNDAENEVEQVVLQPKRDIQHFSDTIDTDIEAPIPSALPSSDQVVDEEEVSDKALEIVKSIVYGGLPETLTSLTVVITAAWTDASISSIVTLALATLVSGLFIFVHNLQELKAEEPQTEAPVDRYKELLGERNNFCLHAFIAVISYTVFGLVPPLVYGFSFHENGDNNDFKKLAAAAVASLLCITLLSIAKAYTKKAKTLGDYLATMTGELFDGAREILPIIFKPSAKKPADSTNYNKNLKKPRLATMIQSNAEPYKSSLEVGQSGVEDTTKSVVNIAGDSGAQIVAIEINIDNDMLGWPYEQATALSCVEPEVASNKVLEVLKSIVYGGLTESLASLTVVTSAVIAGATILSIFALVLANLISGLFIFVYDLGELKVEEPTRAENQTEASMDRYNKLLGKRKNVYLHAFITIISFIVFGLVPPLVYSFSFHENSDNDFKKLGAVVVVSLLCITLLSIAKAYTKESNTLMEYPKTVIYYLSCGVLCLVLSYLAGDLVKKLLEKVKWLEPSSNLGLHVPGMSVQKTEWSSY